MSAFRGILTGFGMAAIKDKEAKDNAKMEVVKAAGLDYHTNQLPAHKKSEASRAKEYSMVSKLLNSVLIISTFRSLFSGSERTNIFILL